MDQLKTFSILSSTLPEDGEWEADAGKPVGRGVLECVTMMFSRYGFTNSGVYPRDYYGWEAVPRKDKLRFHLVIQPNPNSVREEYLLICDPKPGILPFGRPDAAKYQAILDALYRDIDASDQVNLIRAMTKRAFETG